MPRSRPGRRRTTGARRAGSIGWLWNAERVRIDFQASPAPTLGVEWELALVDRRSRDLRNDATHLFARAKARLPDPARLHKELLRNTVEVVSGVCHTVDEAMRDLRATLEGVLPAADALDIDLYGGGPRPFASWTGQQ